MTTKFFERPQTGERAVLVHASPDGLPDESECEEFAELARQVLDIQEYPDLREYPEGPPELPYDAAGWTLSAQIFVGKWQS